MHMHMYAGIHVLSCLSMGALLYAYYVLPCFPGTLDGFLRSYVDKYKFLTITTAEWKENFLQYFHKQVNVNMILMWDYLENI